jgi:hypothetical protein
MLELTAAQVTMKSTFIAIIAKGGYTAGECEAYADRYVRIATSMEPRSKADLALIKLLHTLMAK